MESKKNPSKDIHRLRGMFFQIGLGISIAIVITAFEWTTQFKKPVLRAIEESGMEIFVIPSTDQSELPPPEPTPQKIITPLMLINTSVVETTNDNTTSVEPIIDVGESIVPVVQIETDIKEDVDVIHSFPEKNAEPIGGYAQFYKLLRHNLKYPGPARKFNISGKVLVEFIINKDGTVSDCKVVRGIGYGCDEEAKRVISLSKWNPGKQRGNPVRVRMILPIIFQLH